jgi:hypothetical protein
MPIDDNFFALGVSIACTNRQVPMSKLASIVAEVKTYRDPHQEGYGELQKWAAKSALAIYDLAGAKEDEVWHLFNKLANCEQWEPGYDQFVNPVFDLLADVSEDSLRKLAFFPAAATALVGKSVAMTPSMAKLMLSLSVLGGTATGAGAWVLNQDANKGDQDSQVLQTRIDYYNKLRGELKNRVQERMNQDQERELEF